jgi:hypothetical protein
MCELCDGLHGKSEYNLDFLKEKTGSNSALSGVLVDVVQVSRADLENLIYYADTAAGILKENGWPGKAEALESRYMKIADAIGLKGN